MLAGDMDHYQCGTLSRADIFAYASAQETLEVHWGKHHRTYVNNLNGQIKDKPLANKALEEVRAHLATCVRPPVC